MANTSSAQDPNEPFAVLRADGTPNGDIKPRAAVHRDGDWHRAVHVWVAGIADDGEPFLLVQRRSLAKDTCPGRLDATVGGHYRAGETLDEALRETEEEIGVAVLVDHLRRLGTCLAVNESEPGILDREIQDVFLLRDDRPLIAYRPHPVELAALLRLPLAPLLDLLAGEIETMTGQAIAPGNAAPHEETVRRDDFVIGPDRYPYRVAIAAGLVLRGERHVAV